jgi:hypothetical protein
MEEGVAMIQIPVALLEFDPNGNTIWVHSPDGATVLRIKTIKRIVTEKCQTNPVSHCDVTVEDDIEICLAGDAVI